MKFERRTNVRRGVATCLLLFSAVACQEQSASATSPVSTVPSQRVARLTVSSDLITLHEGDRVEVQLAGASAHEVRSVWSSDDPKIAAVDASGVIVANDVGSTTITVAADGKATDVFVTVLPADQAEDGK